MSEKPLINGWSFEDALTFAQPNVGQQLVLDPLAAFIRDPTARAALSDDDWSEIADMLCLLQPSPRGPPVGDKRDTVDDANHRIAREVASKQAEWYRQNDRTRMPRARRDLGQVDPLTEQWIDAGMDAEPTRGTREGELNRDCIIGLLANPARLLRASDD